MALFYRELGFPLDEIAAIFQDPQVNPLERLRARQRQLSEEIARLQRLAEVAERAVGVQKTGVSLTPQERFEVFGEVTFDLSYATEAELKWAHSEGQRQAMARAAAHTKEDWRRLMGEAAAWRAELLAAQAFGSKEMPDGFAEDRWEAKAVSFRPKLALPKSYALSLSRTPAG
ncbi:hypothetical protein SUDANB180_01189 [Streptomyces sp. enrichment culture]